ncbi:unnamed protein product [Owenia fusiformis]|uniref:Uncharacterized protein n=1 Tax=Owenia fusiformis TaxID=6347 RepID=A0A8J1T8B1_OWEFU|nr:unnamed protein product [Owenia fusiformis]
MYSKSMSSLINGSQDASNLKPPKPPSWRDFEGNATKPKRDKSANGAKNIKFTDISLLSKSGVVSELPPDGAQAGAHGAPPLPKKAKHHRKHNRVKNKARIHRTQSHLTIETEELPRDLTASLAEAQPIGIRNSSVNAIIYMTENNRKCEKWLEGVEDWDPLDDSSFAQGSGVEVEVPEEKWDDHLKPPINSSASSSSESSNDATQKDSRNNISMCAYTTDNLVKNLPSKLRNKQVRAHKKYEETTSTASSSPISPEENNTYLTLSTRAKYDSIQRGKPGPSHQNRARTLPKDHSNPRSLHSKVDKSPTHSHHAKHNHIRNECSECKLQEEQWTIDPAIPGLVNPTANITIPGAIQEHFRSENSNFDKENSKVLKHFTELQISPKVKRSNRVDGGKNGTLSSNAVNIIESPIISVEATSKPATA